MKTAALASALVLLALGGCDQSSPRDNAVVATPAATPEAPDYYARRIDALSAKQRDGVLARAIKDAGGDCPALTGSETHAPVEGHRAWTAHCAAGKDIRALDWIVILDPGGVMRIVRPGAL
ncbi:MAG: hypothetical protein V4472_26785 [Pseudomonadota bacterium]